MTATKPERDKVLTVRMSSRERAMLRAVSARRGLSASDWVRLAIREAYESGGKPARPPE